jgi:hypothetical protein
LARRYRYRYHVKTSKYSSIILCDHFSFNLPVMKKKISPIYYDYFRVMRLVSSKQGCKVSLYDFFKKDFFLLHFCLFVQVLFKDLDTGTKQWSFLCISTTVQINFGPDFSN